MLEPRLGRLERGSCLVSWIRLEAAVLGSGRFLSPVHQALYDSRRPETTIRVQNPDSNQQQSFCIRLKRTRSTTVCPGLNNLCFSFNYITLVLPSHMPKLHYLEQFEGGATLQALHTSFARKEVISLTRFPSCRGG